MAELNVTKKSVAALLQGMQPKKFVIPDFQRPYKWDRELCEILWQDLTGFFRDRNPQNDPDQDQEYFLGTIVTYQEEGTTKNRELQVIDGQQRLTSFLLLLRAFYTKLEAMPEGDANVMGLKNQIAPCIWDVDDISRRVTDFTHVHIESRVATEKDNDALLEILKTGVAKEKAKDLYSTNYTYFLEECGNFAKDNPLTWQPLCVAILKKCIILPIECDRFETALTIFSTLNNRGMPLSDSDIFKAQLYRNQSTEEEKSQFTENWKALTETVENAGITLDDLFRYYTHILRARKGDKGKEIGLRKFYAGEKNEYSKLKAPEVMPELAELGDFWQSINDGKRADDKWINLESRKFLHCLSSYPNEYWKYIVSVYFSAHKSAHKEDDDFKEQFPTLLRPLVAWMCSQFVLQPTVNAIKDPCFLREIDILAGKPLTWETVMLADFRDHLAKKCESKVARSLILLHAYLNPEQKELLPPGVHIEHILPKKWQGTNYRGWTKEEAKASLECFGNKVAFEGKFNIEAGNGYFGKKKANYEKSEIAAVKELSQHPADDWLKKDIEARESAFLQDIMKFFQANLATSPAASTSAAL